MTTIDTLMAMADAYAHAKCDVPHAIDYGTPAELDVAIVEHAKARAALQSALTEVFAPQAAQEESCWVLAECADNGGQP